MLKIYNSIKIQGLLTMNSLSLDSDDCFLPLDSDNYSLPLNSDNYYLPLDSDNYYLPLDSDTGLSLLFRL